MDYKEKLYNELLDLVKEQIRKNEPEMVKRCYEAMLEQGYPEELIYSQIAAALAYELSISFYYQEEMDENRYEELLQNLIDDKDLYEFNPYGEWYSPRTEMEEEEKPEFLWQNVLLEHSEEELERIAGELEIDTDECTTKQIAVKFAAELLSRDFMTMAFGMIHETLGEMIDTLMKNGSLPATPEFVDNLVAENVINDYFYFADDDVFYVTEDVQKAYAEFITPEFIETRKKDVWFADVVYSFITCYGVAPVSIFTRLYNTHPQFQITDDEVLNRILASKKSERTLDLVGGKLVFADLLKKKLYRRLEKEQGDRPFVIPSREEIESQGRMGYPAEDPSYKELKQWLIETESGVGILNDEILRKVFAVFNTGNSLMEAASMIFDYDPDFDEDQWTEYLDMLQKPAFSTRSFLLRGDRLQYQADPEELGNTMDMIEMYENDRKEEEGISF